MALAGIVLLTTCSLNKVGLGDAVDITPPKLQITEPVSDGLYFKGAVPLGGTVSDDLKLSTVSVVYTKVDGSTATKEASVTKARWALTIPTGTSDGLAEGKQTITATAYDASGKTTTDTVLVYVDNRAPTVLITSPSSHGDSDALRPQATETLDIKGEVADDSPISQVLVSVVDGSGVPVPTRNSTLNPNPKVADGRNTWLARFYLKDPSKGLQVQDGQEYFYHVEATDQAGNTSSWSYHVNDIPSVMPDLDPGTTDKEVGPLPTVEELGQLDHAPAGTLSSPTGIAQSAFAGLRLYPTGSTTMANWVYRAISAPTIRFSNVDPTKAQNENLLTPGGVIVGNIAPPANSGAVDAASLTVRLYRGAGWPGTLLATYHGTDSSNVELTSLGESFGFKIPLKNGATDLVPGAYSLELSAKTATSDTRTSRVLFFLDSGAPTVSSTTPAAFVGGPVSFSGTASSNLGLDHIEVYETKNGVILDRLPDVPLTGISSSWATDLNLPQSRLGGVLQKDENGTLDGAYDYEIRLVTVSGKTASAYRSFTLDTTPPVAEVAASPLVGTNTVNGDLTMTGVATDANGLSMVRWSLRKTSLGAPTWSNTDSETIAAPPYTKVIDTRAFDDATPYTLWFRATDKAGNTKDASLPLQIDQASDKPIFTWTNADASVTGSTVALAKANLFQNGAKVLASVTDDDGIAAASIQVQIDGGPWVTPTKVGTGILSIPFEQDLSGLADGVRTIALRADDKNGLRQTSPTVSFVLDTATPALSVTGGSGWAHGSVTISGTASDNNGLAPTEPVTIVEDDGPKTKHLPTLGVGGAWTTAPISVSGLADGAHSWTVTATDAVGKTTSLQPTVRRSTPPLPP